MYSSILLIWPFFDIDSGLKNLIEGVQRTNRTTYYGETPFDLYKDGPVPFYIIYTVY